MARQQRAEEMSSIKLTIIIADTIDELAGWLAECAEFDDSPWLTEALGLAWNGEEWLPQSGDMLECTQDYVVLFPENFDLEPYCDEPSGTHVEYDPDCNRTIQERYYTVSDIEAALCKALKAGDYSKARATLEFRDGPKKQMRDVEMRMKAIATKTLH